MRALKRGAEPNPPPLADMTFYADFWVGFEPQRRRPQSKFSLARLRRVYGVVGQQSLPNEFIELLHGIDQKTRL